MRVFERGVVLIGLLAVIGAVSAAEPQKAAVKVDIAAQPIGDALNDFARQSGLQVVIDPKEGGSIKGPRVVGVYTPDAVLAKLLANTGLRYEYLNERTVGVRLAKAEGEEEAQKEGSAAKESERPLGVALVQGGSGQDTEADEQNQRDSFASAGTEESGSMVEEIVVTAQKRIERLQDVPVPVTAINAESLVNSNQLRLQDYYAKVPGLNLTIWGDTGSSYISIRGVTTGGLVNPTAGFVVDDVPFGSSTFGTGAGNAASDFDPSELARVEILRGPQGTLYGANSMGGLIKYVTVDPSTDRVSGRVQVGTSSVYKGDELGYSLRGAVNVPLTDTFAVRASGSTRRDAGYIDNLQTGRDGVNRTESQSGRLAALWRPTDGFSLKLSALYQDSKRDGSPDVHLPSPLGPRPDLGELQQSALINTGTFEDRYQAYSAIMTAKLGRTELTSLSGYSISQNSQSTDRTASFFGSRAQVLYGVSGAAVYGRFRTPKFTQELRLSTPIGSGVQWLLGAFYTHERYPAHPQAVAVNPITGAVAGELLHTENTGSYNEYAAFTNATFQITDRFDIQVGGRASQNKFESGPIIGGGPLILNPNLSPKFSSKDNAFTYLVTPRFKISPDLMMYARLASGYRPGGPNTSTALIAAGLPREYGPDTTQNYEIGAKGAILDGALSFDASLYYIDWKDVQLQLQDPLNVLLQYTLNSGSAKSQGTELSLELRPLADLTISAWGAYNNAELTDVPTNSVLTAHAGDRLPYSARRSGSLSVDQEFTLTSSATGFFGASLSYVGDRKGRFFTGVPQGTFPAYTQVDLRAGASFDSWTINAFVNNVTDRRGILRAGNDGSFVVYAVTYTQPRTVGVSLSRTF